MVAEAVNAWRNGLFSVDNCERVKFNAGQSVPYPLTRWLDKIDNISGPTSSENDETDQLGSSCYPLVIHTEHKSEVLIRNLITRYSLPHVLVLDTLASSLSSASACLSLPMCRRCVIYEYCKEHFVLPFTASGGYVLKKSLYTRFPTSMLTVISETRKNSTWTTFNTYCLCGSTEVRKSRKAMENIKMN